MKHNINKLEVVFLFMSLLCLCGCGSHGKYAGLQQSLGEFVEGKDANIGIAVIIDRKDTVSINGDKEFPMLSVYKFPIALALAEEYRCDNISLDYPIAILPDDLHQDTWSPMTEKILSSSQVSTDTLKLAARELVRYMLQQSDNNASDIVLRSIGGADRVNPDGINVLSTEAEMHVDNKLCYANTTTPLAMAELLDKFDNESNDPLSSEIKQMMETCGTGTGRLAKPLMPQKAVVGHKTGTGFTLPNGRLMAVNDVGYVHLPNGHHYAIAVFIENSGYDMDRTEGLIAGISDMVYRAVANR